MNILKELKTFIKFTGGLETKINNLVKTYSLKPVDVKKYYLESINEVLQTKKVKFKEKEDLAKEMAKFQSDDYRKIWFLLTKKCQDKVKSEGGSAKGGITRVENKAKKIAESDVKRLKIVVGKLKKKLKDLTGKEKLVTKEKIAKYERFIEYATSGEGLSHFVNKLSKEKSLKSFIFKAKAKWDHVANI